MASGITPADSSLSKEAENAMEQFNKYKYSTEALAYEDILRFLVEKKNMSTKNTQKHFINPDNTPVNTSPHVVICSN